MRIACCLALAALALSAAPAAAAEPRVLVMVLPADSDVEYLAAAGFRVAVASPTASRKAAAQAFLDIGQGARVSARVYEGELPRLGLDPAGAISGWAGAVERAGGAPGDLVPGLLGETIRAAGGRTAYLGARGAPHRAAIVAADRAGRIDTVDVSREGSFVSVGAQRALRRHSLVVAEFPAAGGLILFPRQRDLLVLAVAAPPSGQGALLPVGATLGGDSGDALLTSRTTRRSGMVALTDLAPTILSWLDLDVPGEMDGRAMETASGSVGDVESLTDRLAHIKGRRGAALWAALVGWVVVAGALALLGRRRLALRLGLLAAMWLPAVALVTGAIDPSRWVEAVVLALASLALAAGTDRFVRWPRAPLVPGAVVLGAHAVDLVAGSPLIVRSLAGPNPAFGARFYGVGNELEAILSVTVLIGAGAFLAGRAGRRVPLGFALACAVAAVFIGAGRLGADVGGVITLAAGAGAAVLASLPGGITRRAVLIAVAAPALAVALLAAVDLVTGGDAHLTRSVLDADSPAELLDVVERRFDISWESLKQGTTPLSVALFAGALGYGVMRRERILGGLGGDRAFAAGMWGALAATIVGALANDSGPTIFLVGALALVLAAAYVAGKPPDVVLT